ncbi:hypothetical protein ABLO27_16700 [Roseibium sp. SCPC15]|uniref:hypothetical protein n=1 Tax=Roseibium sp. SCP15 TaxID=3141376 RepID=UPI00333BF259
MNDRTSSALEWLRYDKLRFPVTIQSALAGALVSTALIFAMNNYRPNPEQDIFTGIGLASGVIGGLIFSGWYGRPGRRGLFFACLASILSPMLGGAAVGSFIEPGIGTLLGAFMPLLLFITPVALLVWCICLCIIHLATLQMRSKFKAPPPKHCP